MYLYAERFLIQILSFSLGPLLGLVAVAIFKNLWSGLFIGVLSVIFIYLQPVLSDICLKNTAKALKLDDVVLAEGKVSYSSRNQEVCGKLFLTRKSLVFVFNNKTDFILRVDNIIKIKEMIDGYDQEIILELAPLFERKSSNLSLITHTLVDLTSFSNGLISLTVKQSIFYNEFMFRVTNPNLWIKTITILKSRAI